MPHPIVILDNVRRTTQSATFGKNRKTNYGPGMWVIFIGIGMAASYFVFRMI